MENIAKAVRVCIVHTDSPYKSYAASMKEDADLMQHLTHITTLAEQLREMNEEISSKKFATVVLGSLPQLLNNFLTSLIAIVSNFRESGARSENSNFFLFAPKDPFGELFPKIIFKSSSEFLF